MRLARGAPRGGNPAVPGHTSPALLRLHCPNVRRNPENTIRATLYIERSNAPSKYQCQWTSSRSVGRLHVGPAVCSAVLSGRHLSASPGHDRRPPPTRFMRLALSSWVYVAAAALFPRAPFLLHALSCCPKPVRGLWSRILGHYGTEACRIPATRSITQFTALRKDRLARNPFNPQSLISHLTNSNGCGNIQFKVLLTVSPFRPSFLQPPALHPANNRFLTPLLSSTSELLFSQLLCFHIYLRCPLVFPCPRQASPPNPLSPLLLITSLQSPQFHALTHSFAQQESAISHYFNSFRTLSLFNGGWYPPSAARLRTTSATCSPATSHQSPVTSSMCSRITEHRVTGHTPTPTAL